MRKNAALIVSFVLIVAALTAVLTTVSWADTPSGPPKLVKGPVTEDVGPLPPGRIAYIDDGSIWVMDTDGKNRLEVCDVANARGRISWSPDNTRIAFSRQGKDANKLPSDEGGTHLLFDVFIAFLDSAQANPGWWNRITFGLGGTSPEWSPREDLIYLHNDINANFVDYISPSFQLGKVNPIDGHVEYLRKDWQTINTNMMLPSVSRDGKKLAFVINYSTEEGKAMLSNRGIKVINIADIMLPESEMRKPTPGLENAIAPSWSPDGQWLAFMSDDIKNPGIYIIKNDLSEIRQIFSPTVSQQLFATPVGWAPNSKWITFATADGIIYVLDINGSNLKALSGPGKRSCPTWSN